MNRSIGRSFWKKFAVVVVLLAMSLSLAQLSDFGPMRHGDGFVDTNVYKYVGQTIRDGGMPYRDTFDHKGPLLYVLHALVGYIDEYRGAWILEFVAITVSVFAFYKISRLLKCRSASAILAVATIFSVFIQFFDIKGGCTCLFSVPFASVSLYFLLKYILAGHISSISVWLCGLCCAAVLMMRPNFIAVWAVFGVIIAFNCIKTKKYRELLRIMLLFFAGIITVIAPLMIWICTNGAFSEFWSQYIEFNFFYSASKGDIFGKAAGFLTLVTPTVCTLAIIIMIYRLIVSRDKLDIYFSILLLANIAVGCISGREYGHYVIGLMPSLVYPYAVLFRRLPQARKRGYSSSEKYFIAAITFLFFLIPFPYWRDTILEDYSVLVERHKDTYKNSIQLNAVVTTIRELTEPDEKIQVFRFNPAVYHLSGRRSLTRFPFLTPEIESYKNNHDEYFGQLEAEKPKIIVVEFSEFEEFGDMKEFLTRNDYRIVYPSNVKIEEIDPKDKSAMYVFYRPQQKY